MTTETGRFAHARRLEAQLNARQRDVLDLLVAGKTNGEIAEALGMTLDGAKWNVSEILGKLGFESREAAADYWRWRKRPAGQLTALRGLVGVGVLKWAGGAAAVLAVAVVIYGLFARPEERSRNDLPPFYLEARIEVTSRSHSVGTNVAGADLSGFPEERTVSLLRWWSANRDNARQEIEYLEGDLAGESLAIVADGKEQWVYRSELNSYSRTALPSLPDGVRVRPIAVSLLIGPAFASSPAELTQMLAGWAGEGGTVTEAGRETILGRSTRIIQMTPASRGSSSSPGPDGSPQEVDTSSGVGRIWLDEERMVVMRYVIDDEPQSVFAEVTRYDHDARPPKARLRFDPPAGARLDDNPTGLTGDASTRGSGSSTAPGERVAFVTPVGFFEAEDVPEDLQPYAYQQEADGQDRVLEFSLRYAAAGSPRSFVLQQMARSGGLSPAQQKGERLMVAGSEVWLGETAGAQGKGALVTLATWRNGLAVSIQASELSRAEVLAIAAGLRRVD